MVVNAALHPADTKTIANFIRSLGWDETEETGYPIKPGPEIINAPDRILFVTGTGGPGYVTDEGSAEAVSFQARLRGPADDPDEPDSMIHLLDRAILAAPFPVQIGPIRIQSVSRAGSPPAPLPVDPNDLRHEFTCSYVMIRQGN